MDFRLWMAFIGWFLLNAAQESVAQVAIRETLSGLHAADVMSHECLPFAQHVAGGVWTRGDAHRAALSSGDHG